MRKLSVFNFLTIDGYFEGPNKGDISWHSHAGEENKYAEKMLGKGNTLVFGRITYEMMAGYWPTDMAAQNDPVIAQGMNRAEKIVFSKTMHKADWQNTRVVNTDPAAEIRRLKETPGNDLTILGSGQILTLLAEEGLIDEYQFMLDPVAIGSGNALFKGIRQPLSLQLKEAKALASGIVLLTYRPA